MKVDRLLALFLFLFNILMPFRLGAAEEAPKIKKKWKNVTELSVVSANGNTKSTTSSGKNMYTYDWRKTGLELAGGGLGSKSGERTTAENYFASEKVLLKFSERNYSFEKSAWNKDRFSGIRNRYDNSVGLGRELLMRPKDKLRGELGGGYVVEERVNSKTNSFGSGRVYGKYTRTISDTSHVTQDAEYQANFEDKDDFRVNTESALTAAVSSKFSLKLSYVWKHVGKPPIGFGRNDTITSVALIASY